jgi:hypothetical protein
MLHAFRVPKDNCINCGKTLDSVQGLHGVPARPGDVTICIRCGMIMAFTEEMKLGPIEKKRLQEIKDSAIWAEIVALQECLDKII